VSLPGCERASATRSCSVFTGTEVCVISTLLPDTANTIGEKSFVGS
jgi:hypothetical protein